MSDKRGGDDVKIQEEETMDVSYFFPNRDKYEGKCSRSAAGVMMRSGVGEYTSADGVTYTGEWHEDKMHGRGTLRYPSGALYEGEFKDNMYNGAGVYTFPDGGICKGHFHNNRLEGQGVFTNPQGLVWEGEFHGKAAIGLKLQPNITKSHSV
ncbi:uncharacterized protein V6R79_005502 [Siganus canaliculatus]